MSRTPSVETQLRTARREIHALDQQLAAALRDRDQFRARASRAESECAEWKRRFDALLARDEAMLKARSA